MMWLHMRLREIEGLIANTADPSFAVDDFGRIAAWNSAAEAMFALSTCEAIGRTCNEVVQGTDECGAVCSANCTTRQAGRKHRPIGNFDLQAQTATGKQWCNVSVLNAAGENGTTGYAIHILRQIDVRKRLEMLMFELLARDFVATGAEVPAGQARVLTSSTRSSARESDLSAREREVLKLLGKGVSTRAVAEQLEISCTTVNNHVQHILHKLDAHTRLEAFHRAQRAGLL